MDTPNKDPVYKHLTTDHLECMLQEADQVYREITLDGRVIDDDSPEELVWVNRYNDIEEELIQRGYYD